MLSVKQVGIKYHFLSFWMDSTSDWTPISRAIGEHSTYLRFWIISNLIKILKKDK